MIQCLLPLLFSGKTRNFKKYPVSNEGDILTHPKLSHDDGLVHIEELHSYLYQEGESKPAEKIDVKICEQ